MSKTSILIIVALALVADLFITYLFNYSVWFPYFLLSVLPALFLYTNTRTSVILSIVVTLFLWFFAKVNIGIAFFAVGLLAIFIKDVVINIFHTTTWQSIAAATIALIFCVVLIGLVSNLLTEESFLSLKLLTGLGTTAIISFIFSLFIQRKYA